MPYRSPPSPPRRSLTPADVVALGLAGVLLAMSTAWIAWLWPK